MSSIDATVTQGRNSGIITKLAELPRDTILDINALAEIFGVVERTIRRMERRYELPPSIKLRTRRCWKAGAVLDWIDQAFAREEMKVSRQLRRLKPVC